MGRGDKKTGKGKTFRGSFGNSRPHNKRMKNNRSTKNTPAQTAQPTRQRP